MAESNRTKASKRAMNFLDGQPGRRRVKLEAKGKVTLPKIRLFNAGKPMRGVDFPPSITASKFREQCFSLLDHLGSDGIVITKRGKPVAKLVPLNRRNKPTEQSRYRLRNPADIPGRKTSAHLIGILKGKLKVKGNILSTGLRWDAES